MALFIRDAEVDALAEEVRKLTKVKPRPRRFVAPCRHSCRKHVAHCLSGIALRVRRHSPTLWGKATDPSI